MQGRLYPCLVFVLLQSDTVGNVRQTDAQTNSQPDRRSDRQAGPGPGKATVDSELVTRDRGGGWRRCDRPCYYDHVLWPPLWWRLDRMDLSLIHI